MATKIPRDARRRRIVERGSDRLALITGRIQSLPSSSSPHHSHSASSPSVFFDEQDQQSDHTNVAHQDVHQDAHRDAGESADAVARTEPQLRKCETSVDTARPPPLDFSSNIQPSQTPPAVPTPSNSALAKPSLPAVSRPHRHKLFTAKQISSSISASENIRIACSITIAFLTVLSHLSIPLLSSIIKSIIATRPLYLVLLTDVTVVLARVLYMKQRGPRKSEEEAKGAEDADVWAGVGQALETGLLLYKAIGAAFMDCSIYAVVVICGLSLL